MAAGDRLGGGEVSCHNDTDRLVGRDSLLVIEN